MNTVVRNVLLFSDPPVLYRTVDLAGIPGDVADAIPLEIESSLPFSAEEAALAWTKTAKTEYLVAAVPRALLDRAIERLGSEAAAIRSLVPWALAVAVLRARGGKGEREIRTGGYRFRFDGARLVGAEADPSPDGGEGREVSAEEAAAAVRRAPIDFAEVTGRASTGSGAGGRVAVVAGILLLASFGAEIWAQDQRTASARLQRDESLRTVFPGGNVNQPKERLTRRARELDARLAVLEGVLSKKASALSLLADLTQAAATTTGAPILVRDLRILEDRVAISGWAESSEAAERFRDRLAGVDGIDGLEGPEIRGAGQGYEFTLEARVVRAAAPSPEPNAGVRSDGRGGAR